MRIGSFDMKEKRLWRVSMSSQCCYYKDGEIRCAATGLDCNIYNCQHRTFDQAILWEEMRNILRQIVKIKLDIDDIKSAINKYNNSEDKQNAQRYI